MALTPEDVVNKRFQPTKFREGYDQDEVDDFLDEVVVELRRLNQENEELKQRLVGSDSRIAELQRNAASEQTQAIAAPAPVVVAPQPVVSSVDETESTNNLLQLARRLHEEHVREGVEKRDALIAEGHATAARVVAEAEAKQRAQITALESERTGIERQIEELRSFERDYRAKLKSYIETHLRDLDSTGVGTNGFKTGGNPAVSGQFATVAAGDDRQTPPTFQSFGG
ncbi:DivIVA domain-containing protein [Planctomonas sp. JC2975]|uniref:DivIVA domain-containing protein n=1 Tax=Planctomonas sp. JC2975 TaxID=2729626 RepID=UPI001475EFB1|nr:DivIVA domain-containing protein [Planctomonas sp. JC2975]NNC10413.1 DivIVA domain-containing protein [Planctomonas sp. JC2975]